MLWGCHHFNGIAFSSLPEKYESVFGWKWSLKLGGSLFHSAHDGGFCHYIWAPANWTCLVFGLLPDVDSLWWAQTSWSHRHCILEIDMDQKDIRAYSKPSRGQSVELLRDVNTYWMSSFTDYWIWASKDILNLDALTNIYRSFKDRVCHYQLLCCILSVSTVTPEEPVLAGVMLWYVQLRWISIEGGWNASWNNALGSREQRMKGSLVW